MSQWLCAMGYYALFDSVPWATKHNMDYCAEFGYVVWVKAKNLVMRYGP